MKMLACILLLFVSCFLAATPGEAACGSRLAESDNGTLGNMDGVGGAFCNYEISVPSNKQINLTFIKTELGSTNNAILNYILVFDGSDCLAPRIGVVYGRNTTTFISSSDSITALFITDSSNKTFRANYSAENCGKEMNTNHGHFYFRGTSGTSSLCIWRLTVEADRRIQLHISNPTLIFPGSWLRVLDGNTCGSNEIFYATVGDDIPYFNINSTSNVLTVLFASASGSTSEGMKAKYWSEPLETSESANTVLGSLHISGNRNVAGVSGLLHSSALKHKLNVASVVFFYAGYYMFWLPNT